MSTDGELWHIVEAKRDDGTPTMFRIRELDPLKHLDRIFVVEMPYPATEMSGLPSASAYMRLSDFDEQWLRPACRTLGWELVGSKTEDGSFFLYMYGGGDPNELVAKLSPFDANLGFYDDADPEWLEYATLRTLLDQAKAIPRIEPPADFPEATAPVKAKQKKQPVAKKPNQKPKATATATATVKAKAKPKAKSKAKSKAKAKPVVKKKRPAKRAATKSKPAAKRPLGKTHGKRASRR